jgi:sugar phosphate isomerase/epimerase
MFNRRDFIKTSLASVAGMSLGSLPACTAQKKRRLTEIGLQVSTIRQPMQQDWERALREVAEIGYDTLEMGGYLGESLDSFKAFLKEVGLTVLAGGSSIGGFLNDTDKLIKDALAMGKKYLICYWPWTDSAENKTLDDWKGVAENLNLIGNKVQEAGLGFTYHNHDIEFKITEEQIPFDILLENTDPDLVAIEIDLYWIAKGNQDPLTYFEKYPGRFPLWHVKDMDNTPERSFACVGQGIIDFPKIFAQADQAGMQHIFVEHDRPGNPMECARVSYEYLHQLRY